MLFGKLLENSLIFNYWEYVLIASLTVYFLSRIFQKNESVKGKIIENSDEKRIREDAADGEEYEEDHELTPSLEVSEHVKYPGATVTLVGGVDQFFKIVNDRRSVRKFSKRPVDIELVKKAILCAGTSPSGAHTEPWTYCLIKDDDIKMQIREIVENEEFLNYSQRMSKQWTTDLKPLRTNHVKEYLSDAPYLILVFKQTHGLRPDGKKKTHYYNEISVAISVGILLTAIQSAGLSSLTTTPLNCGPALRTLLNRPSNEKLMVLLPVGYAHEACEVPDLSRKSLDEILEVY